MTLAEARYCVAAPDLDDWRKPIVLDGDCLANDHA